MATVTNEKQAAICKIIENAVRIEQEIAVARLMTNEAYSATSALKLALFSAHDGSDVAMIEASFALGELSALVPTKSREYRELLTALVWSM